MTEDIIKTYKEKKREQIREILFYFWSTRKDNNASTRDDGIEETIDEILSQTIDEIMGCLPEKESEKQMSDKWDEVTDYIGRVENNKVINKFLSNLKDKIK
jgi:hypothetical protein